MSKPISHPPVIIIPARLAATRLPRKPLLDIAGKPMIVRVWEQAMASGLGPVVVAAAELEIAFAVEAAGGIAILTDPDLPSGSDRVLAAVEECDPDGEADLIVNLQGDMPEIDPKLLALALEPVAEDGFDIGTLVVPTHDPADHSNQGVVKAIVSFSDTASTKGRALWFTRAAAPTGDGPLFHHVGIYAYRRSALERFCDLEPTGLERRERLEQLRALEGGLSIGVRTIDKAPAGIDTEADLEAARSRLGGAPVTKDDDE